MAPSNKDRLQDPRIRLPPRPKRPMNTYTSFVKDYWGKNRSKLVGKKKGAPPSTVHALKQWKKLDAITRKTFAIEAMKDRDRYLNEMKEWHLQREFLKRPANPYILFVQEKWASSKKKGNNRQAFGKMSKTIAKEWFRLSGIKYMKFRSRYQNNMRDYLSKLEEFGKGGSLDNELEDFEDECFDPIWPPEDSDSGDKGEKENISVKMVRKRRNKNNAEDSSKSNMDQLGEPEEFCPEDT